MSESRRPTVAVFYPLFAGGGAEAVALWMLQALVDRYDLTLFSLTSVDLARLDAMYGTQLADRAVRVRAMLPPPLVGPAKLAIANSNAARDGFYHACIRWCREQAADYDLILSAYNAADLGKPGVQYVHWVGVLENPGFYWISGFSEERMRANHLLVNSRAVAAYARDRYGVEPEVVYPPVVVDAPQYAWEDREDAFICSGRLTRAKQPHKAIRILERVRDRGFDVKLHLTGGGGGVYGWHYRRFLQQEIDRNADWVTLHENLRYADYIGVMARCRYGFHHKQEPFGISIAEMLKTGLLPFVRSEGGQVEIVGEENTDLLFAKEDEAVEKIVAVLGDRDRQRALAERLAARRSLFSTERFSADLRRAVDGFWQARSGCAGEAEGAAAPDDATPSAPQPAS